MLSVDIQTQPQGAWFITPGAELMLQSLWQIPCEAWPLEGLRQSAHRTHYRLQLPQSQTSLFVKVFDPLKSWKRPWRQHPGRREWDIYQKLSTLQLPVPQAHGLCERGDGKMWLFLAEITGENLASLDPQQLAAKERQLLIAQLAVLIQKFHAIGLHDPDRHAGNYMYTAQGKIMAIDFHKARFARPLNSRQRESDLVVLFASLMTKFTPQDRVLFLAHYQKEAGQKFSPEKIPHLEMAARRLRQRKLQKKSYQAVRSSRRFLTVRLANYRGVARHGMDTQTLDSIIKRIDHPTARLLKQGSRTRILEITGTPPLIVKGYLKKTWTAKLRSFLGWGRARRAWQKAFWLETAEVNIPHTMALLEGPQVDYLISEKVPSAQMLNGLPANSQVAEQTANTIARIHLAGCRGRDFRAENFLVATQPKLQVFLVDFDGIKKRGHANVMRDLLRLHQSFPNIEKKYCVSFLRQYFRLTAVAAKR